MKSVNNQAAAAIASKESGVEENYLAAKSAISWQLSKAAKGGTGMA
jgi:hypothetical protein